jgi:GDP-L-fucose synthase
MNLNDKIYIAGHKGLVGSAIVRQLESRGFTNLLMRTHKELDLTSQEKVQSFFQQEKPDYVILAAAKVGGIHANNTYPADFIYQNMMIGANVINSAYESKVKRLLFLGSTCIYPKAVEQPMREDALLTDVLESTNEPYALAKIAGIKLCESYNRQYNTDFRSVIPTNLYGEGDSFGLENSHVIPAIMRKVHLAKCIEKNDWKAIKKNFDKYPIKGINKNSTKEEILKSLKKHGVQYVTSGTDSLSGVQVGLWGTGNAMREFLYVGDMALASIFVLELDKDTYKNNTKPMLSHINVGTGVELTILQIAEIIKHVIGFKGELIFDTTRPDGTMRKGINSAKLVGLGWQHQIELEQGIQKTYNYFLDKAEV